MPLRSRLLPPPRHRTAAAAHRGGAGASRGVPSRGVLRIVRNAADDSAEVTIYDEIGAWYGVEAKRFVADLKALDVGTIHLRINSPGGSVFDAVAIANALREHEAHVVAHVDGLAASAASFIAIAADEVRMADNAFFMIHDPWGFAMGTADEMRKTATMLDKVAGMIVGEYEKKTGRNRDEIAQWMTDETWFTAAEALDAGFVDAIDGTVEVEGVLDAFDLSVYANVPDALCGGRAHAPDSPEGKRAIERALRDAGLSRTEAKRVAALAGNPASGRSASSDADDEDEPPRDVAPRPRADGRDSLSELHDGLSGLLASLSPR